VAVVVDVLSFTTTLTVAVDAGTSVLPYRWNDATAAQYAREHDAVLAVARSQAKPGQISLSPLSLRQGQPPARLVLPSPNGSTIAHELGRSTGTCLGASLRNAGAVADWISNRHGADGPAVAVVAAGERWPDGSLRPAVEDLWGAGAVLAALEARGWRDLSPEAQMAAAAWNAVAGRRLRAALLGCASGRELAAAGFEGDVLIAAEFDQSASVPLLADGGFAPAS